MPLLPPVAGLSGAYPVSTLLLNKKMLHLPLTYAIIHSYARESYRSGHNELHSKCSCPLQGTWVRIPHSPSEIYVHKRICRLWAFFIPAKAIDNTVKVNYD